MRLFGVINDEMLFSVLKRLTLLFLMFYLMLGVALVVCADSDSSGRWSRTELVEIITSAKLSTTPGEQIVSLSSHFIDTPYAANTLVGDPQTAEQLIINLDGFDCFTFLDVIEALRRAYNIDDFPEQLKNVRYFGGTVRYESRRHFFSSWIAGEVARIQDVTVDVGQGRAQKVEKQLNRRSDGSLWLPGIAVTPQQLHYIPSANIDMNVLSALVPGDYVGIYSNRAGLDVSHTGLIVKNDGNVMLRHASSRKGINKVVDEDLLSYLRDKPGLVVYRAKP